MAILHTNHTSLASFPLELVEQICTHLTQKSLSHLSKTCKLFQVFVQPILFSSFKDSSNQGYSRRIGFLRALVTRPDLAKVVNIVEIYEPDNGELTAADQKLIEDCVIHLGAPCLPSEWATCNDEPHRMTVVELIIAYTPNLEVLSIPLDYDGYLDVLQHLTGKLFLPRLKHLTVDYFDVHCEKYDVSMQCVQPLLEAAPNLATLNIPTFNDTLDDRFYPIRSLRHLTFDGHCTSKSEIIVNMLASCPLLETFSMYYCDAENPGNYDTMAIWHALEQRNVSLRKLFLTIQLTQTGNPVAARPSDLGSLQTFTKLEVVKLYDQALDLLFRAWTRNNPHSSKYSFLLQLLPASIVVAEFMEPSTLFIPAMLELSRRRTCPFLLMRRLSLVVSAEHRAIRGLAFRRFDMFGNFVGYNNEPNGWSEVERELIEGFARQGVNFEIRHLNGEYMQS